MLVNATLSIRLRALRDAPGQSFQQDPDLGRDVLHTGTFSTGYVTSARSTSAAKAMAARIPSVVRRGCSDRIWSGDSPAASLSRISSTVIRVPARLGLPIMILGSETIRACAISVSVHSQSTTRWFAHAKSGARRDLFLNGDERGRGRLRAGDRGDNGVVPVSQRGGDLDRHLIQPDFARSQGSSVDDDCRGSDGNGHRVRRVVSAGRYHDTGRRRGRGRTKTGPPKDNDLAGFGCHGRRTGEGAVLHGEGVVRSGRDCVVTKKEEGRL